MRSSASRFDQTFLACLAAVGTYLLIGDFGVRLANTSTDDGLVAYAYFYRYPELFARDAHMLNFGRAALASMLNWLPAVLFKYVAVPPELLFWAFTFLQSILLVLAMYRLALVMMASREAALIAAVFTLAWQPHWWNAGLFADLYWMPYGAWSALPFFILAGAFALQLRFRPTALGLLIGGLIHPIHGLFAAAMIGVYWLVYLLRDGQSFRQSVAPLAALGIASVAFLLPVTLLKLGLDEVPSAEMLSHLLKNGHAVPWANAQCSYCMPLFVKSMVAIPVVSALALIGAAHPEAHPRLRLFLATCAAVALAAFLLHVSAYLARNAALIRVIASRSTILLLAFAVPPLIWLAWRVFSQAKTFAARFVAGYIVVWPSPMALTAALLLLPSYQEPQRAAPSTLVRVARALGLATIVLVLMRYVPVIGAWIDSNVLGRLIDTAFIWHLFGAPSGRVHTFLVAYLVAILMFRGSMPYAPRFGVAPLALVLLVPLSLYLFAASFQIGRGSTSGEAREYYEVQAWARESTPPDATFVVGGISIYEGWRNYTHRAQISVGACGYYVCTKAAREEAQKAAEFFDKFGNPHASTVSTQGLIAFARNYGGDYAVRRTEWAPLNLPIAFQNGTYVVYDLR